MAENSNNEVFHWSISEIAEAFNLNRDTTRRKLNQAGLKPVRNKKYRLDDVARVLFGGSSKSEEIESHQDPDKMLPKERKDWFQSQNEKLKYLESAGQLIKEHEYRKHLYENYNKIVSFFENLPDLMERTGLFTPEQLELLEAENDKFRAELHLILNDVKQDD